MFKLLISNHVPVSPFKTSAGRLCLVTNAVLCFHAGRKLQQSKSGRIFATTLQGGSNDAGKKSSDVNQANASQSAQAAGNRPDASNKVDATQKNPYGELLQPSIFLSLDRLALSFCREGTLIQCDTFKASLD